MNLMPLAGTCRFRISFQSTSAPFFPTLRTLVVCRFSKGTSPTVISRVSCICRHSTMKSQTCSGCMPCVVCRSDLQIPFSCEFSMLYSTQHSLIWLPGPTFCSEVCVTPAACLKSHVHISCERSGHTPRQQVSSNFRSSVTISEATHLKISPHPAFA